MPASSRNRLIPLLVIACITAFLQPSPAEAAAKVKLVQSGTATILPASPVDSTYTATVPITSVDPSKAFLIFSTRHNDNTPTGSMVRGRIASATTLEFVRVDDPADLSTFDVQWYVVEYESGVSVQRGAAFQTTTLNNVTLPTPVASLNQAFVTWSKTMTAGSVSWAAGAPAVAQLTSTSNLQIRGAVNRPNDQVWWQVVEFTDPADINVQRGTDTTMGPVNPSVTVTLGTPVDPAKTFVLAGFLTTSGGSDVGRRMLRAVLTNSTTITIDRGDVGDNISEITWQAIELNDGSSVQHGSENFTTGQAQSTVSISSVDLARSAAFASVQPVGGQNMGSTPYIGDDVIGVSSFTMDLTSPTQVVMDRNSTVSSADVGWFVVEFGSAADLAVTKTVDDPNPNVGGTIVYTVALANNGPDGATGVELTDLLPAGVTYVSHTVTQGTYVPGTGLWTVGSIAVAGSDTLTITANVNAGTAGQTITNTAAVTASDQADTNAGNDSDSADITVQAIDLAVTKTVDDPNPSVGGTIVYTVALANNGPDTATGVELTDLLPTGVTYSTHSVTQGTYVPGTGLWTVGSIVAAASDTLLLTATVDPGTEGQTITNTASVTASDQEDTNPGNDSDSADILVALPSGETQITSGVDFDQRPCWNPLNGTQIVFDSDRSGNEDLWIVPSIGGTPTQLTTDLPLDRHPDWSSDGAQIVYSSRRGGSSDPDLWLIPAGGGTPVLLVANVGDDDRFPAFSPDGNLVAFTRGDDIWVIPSTGGTAVQVTTDPAVDAHPTWSPDGAFLAFQSNRSGNNDIWIVPSTGGTDIQVTMDTANEGAPDWSPAGNQILFQSNRAGNNDIWMIAAFGGTAIPVTSGAGNDAQPDWSPNGTAMAFNRDGDLYTYVFPTDLAVTKTTDDPTPPEGGTFNYSVVVTNNGPQDVTGVEVTDPLPTGVTFQSASATQGTYVAGTGVWTVGSLVNGASDTLTITVTVDAGTAATTITNTAYITAADQPHGTPSNDIGSVDIIVAGADLAVTKSVDDDFPNVGQSVVYSVVLTNNGPDTATNVQVTDNLPAGVTYQSSTATTGSYNDVTGLWSVPSVANGVSDTLAITVTVDAGTGGTTIVNTAGVTASDQGDTITGNNSDGVSFTVQIVDLSLEKVVDVPAPNVGETIVYTVTVANAGPDAATGVEVTDNLPTGVSFVSSVASQGAYVAGTGVWTVGTVASGGNATLNIAATVDAGTEGTLITNTASVSASDQADSDAGNDSDSAVIAVPSGPAEVQLTTDPGIDQRPAWSPDGSQIVFDSDRTGNPDLWLVPSAGGTEAQLTTQPLLDRHPDWSPDGTQIVYSSRNGGSADPELWLIPAGGGTPVLLAADVGADDRFPAFSPDGLQVAFTKDSDIWVVPSSGGTPVQLTTDPAADIHPTWSPDGTMIAFQSDRTGNNDIWKIPATGGTAVQVTTDFSSDSAPDWSPSGNDIAFYSNRSGDNELWMIPANGGTAVRITHDPGIDVQPAWSTSGSRIAFARDGDIWIYNFPTELEITKVVDDPTPDPGDTIVFTVVLTNNGPDGATNVEVTDLLAAGLTFQSAAATLGTYDGGTGLWDVGTIGGGATDTLVITATVDLGTGSATLVNTASVTASDQLDWDSGNNSASASVTVNVVLAVSSAADQTFAIGDPATLISPITVTDDGTTPAITAANDLRIRVPAGLALDWDTTDLTATISGTAAAKVSGTVAYEDAGKTLVLDVTSDFAAGEQVTVADLSFTNFTAASSGNLELETGNDGLVSAIDDKTTQVFDPVPAPEVRFVPTVYSLSTARPNPFRGEASIVFDIPQAGMTQLAIYDVTGRLVRMLVNAPLQAGRYAPVWDGRDEYGSRAAAGVYFVRLQSGTFGDTKKVVRLR